MNDKDHDLSTFVKKLPKIELHAHINGSISERTLNDIIQHKKSSGLQNEQTENAIQQWMESVKGGSNRSLKECFVMFKLIHEFCNDPETAYKVTREVIEEFAADNVKYLELRSTPRHVSHTGMTKRSYLESVLKAIRDSESSELDIIVKFIVSVDRKTSLEEAWDTFHLAEELQAEYDGLIVGLDLSGDPKVGDAQTFVPVFREAKKKGFRLAMHLSEEAGLTEETLACLKIPPCRLGHGSFLLPCSGGSIEMVDLVKTHNIPIEMCLTSNVICQTVHKYDDHHFKEWYGSGHPIILGTDDKGVFNTTLSKEYEIAAKVFDLNKQQLWDLSYQSINYIFASSEVKDCLKEKWNSMKSSVLK